MDEVKFLYDCVKAGKLSTDEAKSFLSSGGSSSRLGGRHLDWQQQFQLETKQVYSYVRVDAKSEWLFTCRDE